MVPVERAELATQDMDLIADPIRQIYVEHKATFRCPDPAQVNGDVRSATADGLNAGLLGYGGFEYTAELLPISSPLAVVVLRGSGVIATSREERRFTLGDVFMVPTDLPSATTFDDAAYASLQVPWAVAASLAEEHTGLPAADLRFDSMAPISAEQQRVFARTAEFAAAHLVTSGATEVNPLILREMTRLAAAALLETFPNTTMTVSYLPGPGWVPPATVRRAASFIEAYANEPVTLDQIAAMAGVTGRALQYAFRRSYGTTPTGYLRRVRLERAHAELRTADPADGTTVAAVARKWGWANPAHFAAAYRRQHGQLPSQTLRT